MRKDIQKAYEPVDDPKVTASRVMMWSINFFGDPAVGKRHNWIRTDVPDIHKSIYEMLAQNYKYQYLTSPRGFAKTTVDSLVWPLYCLYYEIEPFIVLIGKRDAAGRRILRNLKFEIKDNAKLIDVYGDLSPGPKDLNSQHEMRLKTGALVRSIGVMGDIRGDIDSANRPTLIISDDCQAVKHTRKPLEMESHQEWWERDVEFAIDETVGKIKMIGNLISKTCLLAQIMKDPKYKGINFSALVDESGKPDAVKGRSIWESRWPTKQLRAEYQDALKKGKQHVFLLERMNIVSDEYAQNITGLKFHNLRFDRMNGQNALVGDEYPDPVRVNTYLAVDPAFADTKNSDERALLVFAKGRFLMSTTWGKPYWFNALWVLEYIYNHMQPHKIIDESLRLHRKYYFDGVIIEGIGGAQIYEPLMNEAMVQDTFYSQFPFRLIMVKHQPADKKDRIYSGLNPKAKLGQILIRENMIEILDEAENFELKPSPHLLDALETGNRHSVECVSQFMNVNEVMEKRLRNYEEEQEEINYYGVPTSLEEIL